MASDFVAELRPPLVSEASTDGTFELGWSTKLVVMLTMCPAPWLEHGRQDALGDVEEPGEVDADHRANSSSV